MIGTRYGEQFSRGDGHSIRSVSGYLGMKGNGRHAQLSKSDRVSTHSQADSNPWKPYTPQAVVPAPQETRRSSSRSRFLGPEEGHNLNGPQMPLQTLKGKGQMQSLGWMMGEGVKPFLQWKVHGEL